jgi:hypothetical protein
MLKLALMLQKKNLPFPSIYPSTQTIFIDSLLHAWQYPRCHKHIQIDNIPKIFSPSPLLSESKKSFLFLYSLIFLFAMPKIEFLCQSLFSHVSLGLWDLESGLVGSWWSHFVYLKLIIPWHHPCREEDSPFICLWALLQFYSLIIL